jgi:tRNA threonylcarbamoyladenosine biosynthesis protein TsaB
MERMTRAGDKLEWGLAIETSSALGGIALGQGGDVVESRQMSAPRKHATQFVAVLADLCKSQNVAPASIRDIYVSSGPGSFTGLRIGMTVARMMGLAAASRVVAVPTLDVIAQNALAVRPRLDRVAVILDAKRGRVYTAEFIRRDDRFMTQRGPVEACPVEFLTQCATGKGKCAVLGEGIAYHQEVVRQSGLAILPDALHAPRPEVVYQLGRARSCRGEYDDWRTLTPTYIRPPEAEEKWALRNSKTT